MFEPGSAHAPGEFVCTILFKRQPSSLWKQLLFFDLMICQLCNLLLITTQRTATVSLVFIYRGYLIFFGVRSIFIYLLCILLLFYDSVKSDSMVSGHHIDYHFWLAAKAASLYSGFILPNIMPTCPFTQILMFVKWVFKWHRLQVLARTPPLGQL